MVKVTIIIFAITYVLLLLFPNLRAHIALTSAAVLIVLGIVPLQEAFMTVDWNVILMIGGTMGIVSLFIDSKMPALLADMMIEKTPNVKWAVISLAFMAGIISAFIDNVATVLMVAPVALTVSEKLGISPVPSIIAIAISSNLQGAATLVGDATSILLGGFAGMDFLDFFVFKGRVGLFWIVQGGALASTFVLWYLLRNHNQAVQSQSRTIVRDYFPTILLAAMIFLLILASFIPNKSSLTNGLICVTLLVIGMGREYLRTKNSQVFSRALREIDYFTILLLIGLFILIGAVTRVGILDGISQLLVRIGGGNLFVVYTVIVWLSVLLSGFIDNIPYVATMLPVAAGIASILEVEPYVLYFGLLIGATLGGNLTPIGASANITALGILHKKGYEVRVGEFMRFSVPFTFVAVITGYLLVWLIWRGTV
ncbi:MAG: TRAP transporter large permease subunit [Firmicutes bacterium]|nr:TRAP transporter large permease subunit [Bacillota bacterium]